ncbi:MAG: NAD(P)/FAD-dependent oxidoreductase [Planctomycetota bacterium]|nr:MAG: NAD(P)/FAD-dependent oxidoreductase [Planctomycetota bacterium]
MSYDAVIIGAGLSGLAAGIRLAYYGKRVCILERHTTIGGLNSFYRLAGRQFDVGLHAMTNFTPKGTRKGPLARILRQLRFRWEDLALSPQVGSQIAFPGVGLSFTNDFELFRSQVHEHFPAEKDGFEKLASAVIDYSDLNEPVAAQSARAMVAGWIKDPLLVDMIFCPLQFYGSAREHDMDFGQFSVMFRSIFLEGLARPWAGVRLILKNLVRRFKLLGGELRLRAGVRQMVTEQGRVARLVLDDGSSIEGQNVLSSAGLVETMRMCGGPSGEAPESGQLSFVETLSVLDEQPSTLGCDRTIIFYNDSDRFHWHRPEELIDVRSGVICCPNNFEYEQPLGEGMVRITALANYDAWRKLSPEEYRAAKQAAYEQINASAVRFVPDYRSRVIADDTFTPTTIKRFTGHDNGAVYGTPQKRRSGTTHLKNLFICGTDQGLVGIVGTMVSGILMANRHVLETSREDEAEIIAASAEI